MLRVTEKVDLDGCCAIFVCNLGRAFVVGDELESDTISIRDKRTRPTEPVPPVMKTLFVSVHAVI